MAALVVDDTRVLTVSLLEIEPLVNTPDFERLGTAHHSFSHNLPNAPEYRP